jgi:transposase
VISIERVAEIHRFFYVEHMTINAIAVHLGLHHEAVKRVLSPDKFRNKRYKKSKLDIFERYIADTVEQYPRIKAPRLTELLRDRGYEGSVSNVRRYLQAYRARHYKAYLRLEYFPGEQAQVDWADFGKVKVEGGYRRISCFVMVLAHSRAVFARFGYDQTLESFLWGHIEAFSYFKGVARSVLYDNLKSAVIERLDGHIKFNRHLMELAVHYRFSPKACQPYSGNQKGRVERAIRYIRESFFEARTFTDLADLNRQLDEWRDQTAQARPWPQNRERTVREAFSEEQGALIPLPDSEPDVSRIEVVRSGKTPYIHFDCNQYTIPHEYVLVPLTLRVTPHLVTILDKDQRLAEHQRSWSKGSIIEEPAHISALVEQKKVHRNRRGRSVLLTRLPMAAQLFPLWLEQGANLGSSSQRLLVLLDEYDKADVEQAIASAVAKGTTSIDSIRFLLQQSSKEPVRRVRLNLPERLQNMEIRSHDPSQYDTLTNKKDTLHDGPSTTQS